MEGTEPQVEPGVNEGIDSKAPLPTDFDLVVVDMDKVLFEGKVRSVIAPYKNISLAILPGHTPLFTKLDKGQMILETVDSGRKEISLEGGIAKINQYKTVILVGF